MKRIDSNPLRRLLPMLSGPVVLALAIVAFGPLAAAQDGVQFLDPLNDAPLDIALPEDASEAVRQFHQTGENPYEGDEQAIAAGEQIYKRWCQACHLPDGSGRIGPSIVDDTWKYERTGTDKGKFEIIHAGGAGAMQAFGQRLSQDEILEVIAYLNELDRQHP
jgi:cytochrome c-L